MVNGLLCHSNGELMINMIKMTTTFFLTPKKLSEKILLFVGTETCEPRGKISFQRQRLSPLSF
jgi:hypothetical protein